MLGWWWAAYLLKLVLGQVANRFISGKEFSSSTLTLFGIGAMTSCIFGFFTWYIIGQAASFEEQLLLRQQLDQLGRPHRPPRSATN